MKQYETPSLKITVFDKKDDIVLTSPATTFDDKDTYISWDGNWGGFAQ